SSLSRFASVALRLARASAGLLRGLRRGRFAAPRAQHLVLGRDRLAPRDRQLRPAPRHDAQHYPPLDVEIAPHHLAYILRTHAAEPLQVLVEVVRLAGVEVVGVQPVRLARDPLK